LDLCYVGFRFDGNWHFEILAADCVAYHDVWKAQLGTAHRLEPAMLEALSKDFGRFSGEMVNAFLKKHGLNKPDIVCSHGHTVFHEPARRYTLQIGDGQTMASVTGITCVNDFRSLDVALGGQGAPLVPIGDALLFSEFDACLNLGGFSNISFEQDGARRAFDICPVNIVLNELAKSFGQPYDNCGELARAGKLNETLLHHLNSLELYTDPVRPSLSREWVEKAVKPLLHDAVLPPADLMRTFVEHVAIQIARVVERQVAGGRVLVTGGGAYNTFLMQRMGAYSLADLVVPDRELIEFKEALIFAFLGVLRMRNETNVLRSVTGAERDSCSGVVWQP
jgi:anhydro-N-acetylmuramic acid kinase